MVVIDWNITILSVAITWGLGTALWLLLHRLMKEEGS